MTNAPILQPLKTPENFWFSGVFRRYKIGTLPRNVLIHWVTYPKGLPCLLLDQQFTHIVLKSQVDVEHARFLFFYIWKVAWQWKKFIKLIRYLTR